MKSPAAWSVSIGVLFLIFAARVWGQLTDDSIVVYGEYPAAVELGEDAFIDRPLRPKEDETGARKTSP